MRAGGYVKENGPPALCRPTKTERFRISKTVRNLHTMPIRYFAATLFAFTLMHCSGTATTLPLADLDYVEVKNHTGWILRIHGDGGGSLSHKQLPVHHLHYPAQTFAPEPGRQAALKCRGRNQRPICVTVGYYDARRNKVTECRCAPGSWTLSIMKRAIEQMQYAVDAGGSERSCRVFLRQWTASR
jgi:hypothetical protein